MCHKPCMATQSNKTVLAFRGNDGEIYYACPNCSLKGNWFEMVANCMCQVEKELDEIERTA